MTLNELTKVEFAGIHDISETELLRIAARSANVDEANEIWDTEDWWCDELQWDMLDQASHPCKKRMVITNNASP